MPLDMDKLRTKNNIQSTGSVAFLFCAIIREQFGKRTFVKIAVGGKMEKTALAYEQFAKQQNIPLRDLVKQAVDMYGIDFCMKTFKTPYPQINCILSEKMLAKLRVQNKKPLRVEKKDVGETVQQYLDVMKDVDKETAIACVKGGWPEGHQGVRDALIVALKKRKR